MAEAMDFRPLYWRPIASLRHRLSTWHGRLDNACYDLLASECSLTSYLAVAQGHAPRQSLVPARPALHAPPAGIGLMAWGGTMFEYLMPRLMLRALPGTLLAEAVAGPPWPPDRVRPEPGPALGDLRIGLLNGP